MYDERKETFSFRSFFLTLLLLVLFILLMLFLFPTRWEFKKSCNNGKSVIDNKTIQVIYDEIYTNNINRMKEVARGYYTQDKLPKNLNETKKLTLGEMYDKHLILKVKDKNGKECNKEKSYVEVTKQSDGYRLKVNLSCGTQDNYIIVNLSDYSTCTGTACTKTETKDTKSTSKDNSTNNKVSTNTNTSKTNTNTNNNKSNTTVVVKPTKVAVKGVTVSKSAVTLKIGESQTITATVNPSNATNTNTVWSNSNSSVVKLSGHTITGLKEGTSTITIKTSDGGYTTTVKVTVVNPNKQNTTQQGTTTTTTKTEVKKGTQETKTNTNTNTNTSTNTSTNTKQETKPTTTVTYKCKVVDGKYYDSTGKVVTKDAYNKSCNTSTKVTQYQYALTTPAKTTYSSWSAWQTTAVASTSTREVETRTVTEQKKIIEVVEEEKKVLVGTKDITEKREVQVGTIDVVRTGKSSSYPQNCCNKTYRNIKYEGGLFSWEEVTKEPVYKVIDVVIGTENVYKTVIEPVEKEKYVPVPVTQYRYRTITITPATTSYEWRTSKNDTSLLNKGYKLTGVTK